MPIAASRPATTMKTRRRRRARPARWSAASTSSQTTASDGRPLALRIAASACSEIVGVDLEQAIEPSRSRPRPREVGDHHAGVLARDVGQDQVAVRAPRRVRQVDDVADRVRALEGVEGDPGLDLGGDDPQVDHVLSLLRAPGRARRPRRTQSSSKNSSRAASAVSGKSENRPSIPRA